MQDGGCGCGCGCNNNGILGNLCGGNNNSLLCCIIVLCFLFTMCGSGCRGGF